MALQQDRCAHPPSSWPRRRPPKQTSARAVADVFPNCCQVQDQAALPASFAQLACLGGRLRGHDGIFVQYGISEVGRVAGLFSIRRLLTWIVVLVVLGTGSYSAQAQTPVPDPGLPQGQVTPPSPKGNAAERRSRPGNLVGHGGPVKAITVDWLTGRVLTGAFDYALMEWSPVGGDLKRVNHRWDNHGGAVNAVSFGAFGVFGKQDGTITLQDVSYSMSAGDDMQITVWDSNRPLAPFHRFAGHTGKIVGLATTPNGTVASASWDRTARLWDLKTLKAGPVLEGHQGPVNGVAFSKDGKRVFTSSADGQIRAFDVATGALDRSIYKHGWGINVLARLPGGDNLVFGALNGSVAIIDGASGDVVRELPSHDRPVLAVAVNAASGLIATGGGDGVIRVMNASDGSIVEEYGIPMGRCGRWPSAGR